MGAGPFFDGLATSKGPGPAYVLAHCCRPPEPSKELLVDSLCSELSSLVA